MAERNFTPITLPEVTIYGYSDPGYDPYGDYWNWARDQSGQYQTGADAPPGDSGGGGATQESAADAFVAPVLPPAIAPPLAPPPATLLPEVLIATGTAVGSALDARGGLV